MSTSKAEARALSWRQLAAGGAAVAAAFVGLVGFLHTPAGRPLLAFALGGSCPLGMSRGSLTPERREELRRESLGKMAHADRAAPARTALGFDLGAKDRAGVTVWATAHGVKCTPESAGAGLACDAVPQTAVAESGDERGSVYFRFDPAGRLVAVLHMVRLKGAARAAEIASAEQSSLRERLGAPLRAAGAPSAEYLAGGKLRQARAEHRFRDFAATSSVTNMGADGFLVTEEAQVYD